MSVEAKNKALEEVKEDLSKKQLALKIAKVKECDHLVEIDRMDQAIKTLTMKGHSKPQTPMKTGRIPFSSLSCYFCHRKGHIKSRCFEFLKHANYERAKPRMRPNHVKKIWVRKELVDKVRVEFRGPIWVVKRKKNECLVDPRDEHHGPNLHDRMRQCGLELLHFML